MGIRNRLHLFALVNAVPDTVDVSGLIAGYK
jgi:hypothetical protein